jgi:hypothetical protein
MVRAVEGVGDRQLVPLRDAVWLLFQSCVE